MIDRITPISQIQRIAEIQKAQQMQPVRQSLSSGESARGTQAQEGFGALLRQELDKAAGSKSIAFSKHALSRAAERGIEVTPALMNQLADSVERAQAKGATKILAFDTDRAFIINVPNGRVITTISQAEMRDNIFTNIDGAVLL